MTKSNLTDILNVAAGDRSNIPADARPVYEALNSEMQRVKSRAPANFKAQVEDTEKRINLLFDNLNNGAIAPEVVGRLKDLANALQSRDIDQAISIQTELMTQMEQSGPWMVRYPGSRFPQGSANLRLGRRQTSHFYEQSYPTKLRDCLVTTPARI